jgi:DNA-binding MarR family transcriptional regulator/GNAT superfamily N-acetyltransferase
MDVIAELGELALASRLRRLSELLMKEASDLYKELAVGFQARWFALFHTLHRRGPLSVTELADALGLSHPAIGKIAEQLIRKELIRQYADPNDERRRLLELTADGRRLHKRLSPVWREIRRSAVDLLDEAGVDLLADLERVEAALSERSVMDRVRDRLKLPPRTRLEIVDYRPAYKKHFRSLNEEWLSRYFCVEPRDAEVLSDPNRQILKKGGHILFALLDGRVVGTCALIRHGAGQYELSKMAVAPLARRRGVGTALVDAAMKRVAGTGADWLYLQTSPRLREAARLYRRVGFRVTKGDLLPRNAYRRHSIVMRRRVTDCPTTTTEEEQA